MVQGSYGNKQILVVDDEFSVLSLIQTVLIGSGYRTVTASSGEGARYKAASDQRIDLALLDYRMPSISGTQLADDLMLIRPSIKVLYMSGYVGDDAVLCELMTKFGGLLKKPFTSTALLQAVEQALDGKRIEIPQTQLSRTSSARDRSALPRGAQNAQCDHH